MQVALSDRRVASLDPEKQRLIEQQILLEQRQQPGQQNVEAILARSEQVMEICQGILNGEMITPSYTSTEPGLDPAAAPDGAAAVAVTKEVAAVAVASAAAAAAPPPPEVEVKAGKEAGGGSGSPEAPVSPPHHVTPYMNSAALNEIAGELLITVRELREELLQVGVNLYLLPLQSKLRLMEDFFIFCRLIYEIILSRREKRGKDLKEKWFSNASCCRSWRGRWCGCRYSAAARRSGRTGVRRTASSASGWRPPRSCSSFPPAPVHVIVILAPSDDATIL